jgi:NodT family efflux transporter outer membrane factor (OMF) lipoprotein
MRKTFVLPTLLSISVLGTACAVRYEARTTTIATSPTMTIADTTDATVEATWWKQFQDSVLDGLVEEAFTANRDLQAAAARYTAARELAGAVGLLQLPHGGPSVGVSRQHLSVSEAGGDVPNRTASFVQAGFGVTWEADLFGRLRGARRAAAADASVAAMDIRGTQVALAAQVAAAYFELRGAERDLLLIEGLQGRTRQQLETTRTLVAAGRVTRLDLLRAQQVEEELATALSVSVHRIERARNRLATLTGKTPESLQIPQAAAVPLRASALAVGTAPDLLRRRPDVAAAEFRVAAATARAGIARAELFPRVDVTGTVGLIAGSLGRLAEGAAGSWLIAPRLIWNAFDWPRLRREMRAAGALADAAFAEYEETVLQALQESRTALDAYAAANREFAAQERRAQAAADAAGVVFVQYREGLVDSLARTQADRDAIAGALDANRALTAQRLAVVDVYRVLGGGWR